MKMEDHDDLDTPALRVARAKDAIAALIASESRPFRQGDIVRQREEFVSAMYPTTEIPGVFAYYFNRDKELIWEDGHGHQDCVVAVSIKPKHVHLFSVPSWRLELVPEDALESIPPPDPLARLDAFVRTNDGIFHAVDVEPLFPDPDSAAKWLLERGWFAHRTAGYLTYQRGSNSYRAIPVVDNNGVVTHVEVL